MKLNFVREKKVNIVRKLWDFVFQKKYFKYFDTSFIFLQ